MRGRKLSSRAASLAIAAAIAAATLGGCTADTYSGWEPSIFDRAQTSSDLPPTEAIDLSGFDRDSLRLVDDGTVDRVSVYVARPSSGNGYCVIAAREGAVQTNVASACGPTGAILSASGLPTVQYRAEVDEAPSSEGWVDVGDGVSIRE